METDEVKEEIIEGIKETVKCLNCGNEYIGNFCPNCGQNAKTKRLKLKEIISDLTDSIVAGDNRSLRTCFALICRPGHMIREYLQGHRLHYLNPMQVLIWGVSIYALLSYVCDGDPFNFPDIPKDITISDDTPGKSFITLLIDIAKSLFTNKLYYMFLTALLAVGPYWFTFRKYSIKRPDGASLPLNHTEMFYLLIYQSCIEMIFAIILIPFSFINGADDFVKQISNYVDIIFSVIIIKQFYTLKWLKSIKLYIYTAILTVFNVILLVVVLALLLVFAYGIFYGLREVFK